MFCVECGKEIPEMAQFCPYCGNKTYDEDEKEIRIKIEKLQNTKVMLDPSEITEHKEATEHNKATDSSEGFIWSGKLIGYGMMIASIILDLVGIMIIGFDFFIPMTICSAVLFVVGFLMSTFSV